MFIKNLKILFITSLILTQAYSNSNDLDLKNDGLSIEVNEKKVVIKRVFDNECKKINGADPTNIWTGNYANKNLPETCVKSFVTTVGVITPMQINEKIKTIGEIEVINFIEDSQTNKNKLLIDARLPDWFLQMSIPTAVNIPFTYFDKDKYPDDFYDVLEDIGAEEISKDKYDFKNAKELVLFCNGAWCPQSTFAIKTLIAIGYPQEKIKWYRGGMYSWKLLNLTTVSE